MASSTAPTVSRPLRVGKTIVLPDSVDALDQGIAVAERRGDAQAAKEMGVFRKRSQKALDGAR